MEIGKALEGELAQRVGVNQHTKEGMENFPHPQGATRDIAAKAAGFGNGKTYEQAKKAIAEAPPEVVAAMDAGEVSVSLAAKVVNLPEEERQVIAAAPVEQMADTAREAIKRAHVANNSGNNEWYTPADYIALAREVMGDIDTDPATSAVANQTVRAKTFFTADDNGLAQEWSGRVWMNPPYAQPLISDFAEAVASKFEAGEIDQACVLVNNGTETAWFQRMVSAASAVCFPKSRIKFLDPDGNPSGAPLQGQAVIYMGCNVESFADVFCKKGVVLIHV